MNAAEKLAREIARVAAVREHYQAVGQEANHRMEQARVRVNVAPALAMDFE